MDRPDRDWAKAHPAMRPRYEALGAALLRDHGIALWINEIFRSDERQRWLWAQGRTAAECLAKGVDPTWARPGAVVTNAWSAKTSPHGYVMPVCTNEWPSGVPAACALDVVPLGRDMTPWTKDDDWGLFVALTTDPGSLGWQHGLVHFHRPGVAVWDQPHLQLLQWSDVAHDLIGV